MKRNFKDVKFKPWEGIYYDDSPLGLRLLILGESHYRHPDDPTPEKMTTIRALKLGRHSHRYWKSISGLVSEHQKPYQPDIWDSVLFYNYVQHVVGAKPRERPAEQMLDEQRNASGIPRNSSGGEPSANTCYW